MRVPDIAGPAFAVIILAALYLAGRAWLDDHPQHDPWAPLDLRDPPGWATVRKLADLRADPTECRAVLERSGVQFVALEPAGEGACRRDDRTVLTAFPFAPADPPTTCAVAAGLELWMSQEVQPAAESILQDRVGRIEHLGGYSCRRLYGREDGRWSQHATGNAIDIAAFVLEDGRRISVLDDWHEESSAAAFLHEVRDGACETFGTVLSPDYKDAHRDHLHLDQASYGMRGLCR